MMVQVYIIGEKKKKHKNTKITQRVRLLIPNLAARNSQSRQAEQECYALAYNSMISADFSAVREPLGQKI